MKLIKRTSNIVCTLAVFSLYVVPFNASAAPACKGPNKNDPGCAVEPALVDPVVIDSVTVDWLNLKLVVRGSGFVPTTAFTLGTDPVPVVTANVTDTQLDIPFNANIAAEVLTQGNYNLVADGTETLSVYVESQIIDPAATGCPCEGVWAGTTYTGFTWGNQTADCVEVEGPASNDPADIAATILSNPSDPTVFPQYPIGASFYPGDPANSECRLVEIAADASVTDLVRYQINEQQQANCANVLKANVCATP